jgi:hypothetical protein
LANAGLTLTKQKRIVKVRPNGRGAPHDTPHAKDRSAADSSGRR